MEREARDIVLITIDTLRADYVGYFGGENKTPNLDQLAEDGVAFKRAHSTGPGTSQAFLSIFTSLYPLDCENYMLPPSSLTFFTELLMENEYTTAAFHSNPRLSRAYGYNRGFDIFYDGLGSPDAFKAKERLRNIIGDYPLLVKLAKKIFGKKNDIPYEDAESLNKRAIEWLEGVPSPFFLWVHYMEPHTPYLPHDSPINDEVWELNKKYDRGGRTRLEQSEIEKLKRWYVSEIEYTDKQIGNLIKEIKYLRKNPSLIIASDHGASFEEPWELNRTYDLHKEVISVPLILKDAQVPKEDVYTPVSLASIPTTILDLAGVKKTEQFERPSLLSLIEDVDKDDVSPVYSEGVHSPRKPLEIDPSAKRVAVIAGEWKYIYGDKGEELYNMETDNLEQNNLIEDFPKITKNLKNRLNERFSTGDQASEREEVIPDDKEVQERLRKLGYL